LVCTKRPKGGY